VDPLKGSVTDVTTLDLYVYVRNNPLVYIDPWGLDPPSAIKRNPVDMLSEPTYFNGFERISYRGSGPYYYVPQVMKMLGGTATYDKDTNTTTLSLAYNGISASISYSMNDMEKLPGSSIYKTMATGNYTSPYFLAPLIPSEIPGSLSILYYKGKTYVNLNSFRTYFAKIFCEGNEENTNAPKTDDKGRKQLITKKMMDDFSWSVSEEVLDKINGILYQYGITNMASIRLFMATCAAESDKGYYNIENGSDEYFVKKDYKKIGRGAGYIQVTWEKNHLDFLSSINDPYTGDNVAQYIADNYSWEASAWYWKFNDTQIGRIDDYVLKYGDSLGVFFITQCGVNGWPTGLPNDLGIQIRDGKIKVDVDSSNKLMINGKPLYNAPMGWEKRELYYNEAIRIFR
jgi:hypothetical protein